MMTELFDRCSVDLELVCVDKITFSKLARYGLLRSYLRQLLIENRLSSVSLDIDEVALLKDDFCRESFLGDEEVFKSYSKLHYLSEERLSYQATLDRRLDIYCKQHFSAQAGSRFLAVKESLDQVVYSIIRTKDVCLARELCIQIREGEASFDYLAVRYSEGPEQVTRGMVGPIPLSQGHPDLVGRLRSATPGVLMDPFQVGTNWVLLRLERNLPAVLTSDVVLDMCRELFDDWLEEQVDKLILNLHAKETE